MRIPFRLQWPIYRSRITPEMITPSGEAIALRDNKKKADWEALYAEFRK